MRPLAKIFEIVRYADSALAFDIEFIDGVRRRYFTRHREDIICNLLVCCESIGNNNVVFSTLRTHPGQRVFLRSMLHHPWEKKSNVVKANINSHMPEMLIYQNMLIRRIVESGKFKQKEPSFFQKVVNPKKRTFEAIQVIVDEFNSNVPASGVSEKLKDDAIAATSKLALEVNFMFESKFYTTQ